MFKWKKLGKIFDPTKVSSKSWMYQYAQSASAVMFDNFIRVYFCCRPKPDNKGQYVSHMSYFDLDKKNLFKIINMAKKPLIKLGKLGSFDEFGIYPVSCMRDNEKIICFYGGWTRCESVPFNISLGLAISNSDGISFKKPGKGGPVLSFSPNEPFIITSPRIRKYNDLYYLFYTAGKEWILDRDKPEPIYKIKMAISKNLYDWKKLDKDIISNKLNKDEAQASPDVFFYKEKYHMFFSYRGSLDYRKNKKNSYRIGYAYSSDLINWTRDDSQVGIDVSQEGWDSEMICYPNVFNIENNVYMLYQGNESGKYGLGIAKLENTLN